MSVSVHVHLGRCERQPVHLWICVLCHVRACMCVWGHTCVHIQNVCAHVYVCEQCVGGLCASLSDHLCVCEDVRVICVHVHIHVYIRLLSVLHEPKTCLEASFGSSKSQRTSSLPTFLMTLIFDIEKNEGGYCDKSQNCLDFWTHSIDFKLLF